jgi:hypothetical protein
MLIIGYQINEINETVHKQEIRTIKPHPDRARCARLETLISSGIMCVVYADTVFLGKLGCNKL